MPSLADAELGEDAVEQISRGRLAGNLAQRFERGPQIDCHEVERQAIGQRRLAPLAGVLDHGATHPCGARWRRAHRLPGRAAQRQRRDLAFKRGQPIAGNG